MIVNGVDINQFDGATPTLRNELEDAAGSVVGFVGRLVPDKGGALLLQAAKRVLAVCPEAKFVFVGDGPSRNEWETLAAQLGIHENVVFAGVRKDMPGVYASLDIAVLPSLVESMPMCLLEAMASSRPVIATRVGAVPRLVIPEETGLLLKPGDVNELTSAILRLLQDATLLMSASATVRVSIVVACRNEIKHIAAFLDSILAQDMTGIAWEAILADGMSNDGTREILDEYNIRHPQLRVIANPGRIVSTGLNAAIRASRGEIIMRMDAHTSYAADYCRLCLETLESTGADNVGGPARTKAVGSQARAVSAAYHSRFSTGGARFHNVDYEGLVDTVPYGCWRKETLERLGLFDESLVRNQDDELNLRLVRSGGKIWQNPAIASWYSPRPTLSALFRQYFQYGFWKVAVLRKHYIPGSWRHLVPVLFVLTNIFLGIGMAVTAVGASQWFNVAAGLWLALATTYVSACLFASLLSAARHGWATLPYLPAAFAAYHFSYGFGFLMGLLKLTVGPGPAISPAAESAFTKITR